MPRIACPSCLKAGNVPDSFIGKRIKCRRCSHGFEAKKPEIPLVGRTDLENASGLGDETRAMLERALQAGTFTGFRQLRAEGKDDTK